MKTLSLEGRMTLVVAGSAIVGALVFAGVSIWPFPHVLAWIRELPAKTGKLPPVTVVESFDGGTALVICVLVLIPLSAWVAHALIEPLRRLMRALESAVASYRDGDFSMSIGTMRRDEL